MELGDYRVEIIPDTEFRLDGGAMFGVVPRVVWERVCPPDEKNRIRMNMNCVFIDTGSEKILVETGIGEKWSAKEIEMYGIHRERPFAESLFDKTGCRPEDISIVINTHLHFDHAGGNTILSGSAEHHFLSEPEAVATGFSSRLAAARIAVPQFANARYLVSRSEFEHAQNPHERDRASYLPENWEPLKRSGQLELMPDEYEAVEGLKIQQVRGHSETMQTWRLDRGGKTIYGFADLIPMRHHISPAWIAGFDLYPVETLEFKREILPKAVHLGWMCLFYHDLDHALCRLLAIENKIEAVEMIEPLGFSL